MAHYEPAKTESPSLYERADRLVNHSIEAFLRGHFGPAEIVSAYPILPAEAPRDVADMKP